MTFWDLIILILGEVLRPFTNEIHNCCEPTLVLPIREYPDEAASSIAQTIERVLTLLTEETFNLQNGLSAEVPLIAYHVTPGLPA